MSAFKTLFIFALGAAVGSVATYYYAKDKYEKQNNEEQEALLEHYGITRTVEAEMDHEKAVANMNKPDILSYKGIINKVQYNTMSESSVKKEEKVPEVKEVEPKPAKIEMITFDDAGMDCNYEVVSLDLYSDGVIADEEHEAVDKQKYFGDLDLDNIFDGSEYGDCIYVRNHDLELDIELGRTDRTYADTIDSIYGED